MRWKVRLQVRYDRRLDLVLTVMALVVILAGLAGGFFWSPGKAVASPTQTGQPRPLQYYLTRDRYAGDQVLSACAMGFHTASLWEILDTSKLRYNTRLGHTRRDSGHGPPTTGGWVRTGYASDSTNLPGTGNCQSWTSSSVSDNGSFVSLPGSWEDGYDVLMGWDAGVRACSESVQVWCVGSESAVYLPLVVRSYTG